MIGNIGRPPKFDTPEQMEEAIEAYFQGIEENKVRATVSALAYHLGMSTEALRNYENKDDFLATVKRAKQLIEMSLEQNLYGGACAGTIFNLKNNFGWKDRTEHEHGGPGGGPIQTQKVKTLKVIGVRPADAE